MPSLFDPLRATGLTSLRVRHDWRSGRVLVIASRDWAPNLAFARYRRDFDVETLLTARKAGVTPTAMAYGRMERLLYP